MFTRASVHCAERIVATRSSSGLEWSSAHFAPRGRPSRAAEGPRRRAVSSPRTSPAGFLAMGAAFYARPRCGRVRDRLSVLAPRPRRAACRRSRSRSSTPPTSTAGSTRTTRWRTRISARGSRGSRRRSRPIRAEGNPTLLLDSGDTIQGSPTQALAFAGRIGGRKRPDRPGHEPRRATTRWPSATTSSISASSGWRPRGGRPRFPWLSANTLGPDGEPAFRALRREGRRRRADRDPRARDDRTSANWVSPTAARASASRTPWPWPAATCRSCAPGALRSRRRHRARGLRAGPDDRPAARRAPARTRPTPLATEVDGIDLLLAGHAHAVIAPQRLGEDLGLASPAAGATR